MKYINKKTRNTIKNELELILSAQIHLVFVRAGKRTEKEAYTLLSETASRLKIKIFPKDLDGNFLDLEGFISSQTRGVMNLIKQTF